LTLRNHQELHVVWWPKKTWFIVLENEKKGIGECGILRGLSADDRPDYEENYNGCANIHLGWGSLGCFNWIPINTIWK
jgi:hypothetical protein